MAISHDFFDYNGAGIIFNPENYGFRGVYPLEIWSEMQQQYQHAWHLISGNVLKRRDQATNLELYPLHINLWDFVAMVHATMMVGVDGELPPRTVFTGDGVQKEKRADRYNRLIEKLWTASDASLFWTAFYNAQVYGSYPLVIRHNPSGAFPLIVEGVSPTEFFPVLDSNGDVIEYFIYREIQHRVARFRYGINVDPANKAWYVEYWSPEEYTVQINEKVAIHQSGPRKGEVMQGENYYGVAPAAFIPHVRKTRQYGDSQIIGLHRPVLEFNARLADVSTGVRDAMQVLYWGRNLRGNFVRHSFGPLNVYDVGQAFDSKVPPEVFAFDPPKAIKESMDFVEYLWDLILFLSDIPQVALGVDQGSQRSGVTLRVRFWSLESHCKVERTNATAGLNRLARTAIRGLQALGVQDVSSNADELDVKQKWPSMLPQDREELVNELVQRRATNLVSTRTALRRLGDYDNLEDEEKAIFDDMQREAKLEQEAKNDSRNSNRYGDVQTRKVPERGQAAQVLSIVEQ